MGIRTDSVLISHWHLHWVVGRRLTWYMGHIECRLIHACSFFSMIGHHVCMDCVVCVTVK